jgi:ribosomal protein L11 methyltransferase
VLETTLRVRAAELQEALDDLLPALPGGVHLREAGDQVELVLTAAPGVPEAARLRELLGERLLALSEADAAEDWRERRRARHRPLRIADRFLIRPDWAPAPEGDEGLIEIVLERGPAFGTGLHPTTQACLAVLASIPAAGPFADWGCGSGVLSVAAARLGFSPVVAIDVDDAAVGATRANAARNGAAVDVRRLDLASEPPPAAETVVANIPPAVQLRLAGALEATPATLIVSGFGEEDRDSVLGAWSEHGLEVADEVRANEWLALVLR